MAEIINLNRKRKAKARSEDAIQAELNRQKFGRTKAEKQLTEAARKLSQHQLDLHKREPD